MPRPIQPQLCHTRRHTVSLGPAHCVTHRLSSTPKSLNHQGNLSWNATNTCKKLSAEGSDAALRLLAKLPVAREATGQKLGPEEAVQSLLDHLPGDRVETLVACLDAF